MIVVESLYKSFKDKTVLEDISFTVDDGEILAIMGSSGGGKTTLLRCICGLIKPTKGRVLVDDIDVERQPEEARRHLGLVFQNAALFDYLSVADNILFGVRRRKRITKSEERELLSEVLSRVGMEGQEEKLPNELSGGMRKRVGLARAIALRPTTILYDEPTSGLDPITAYAIDSLIASLGRDLGVSSIVVSHDVSSVMRTSERIAFLDHGKLAFLGSKEEFGREKQESIRELVQKAEARAFYDSDELLGT